MNTTISLINIKNVTTNIFLMMTEFKIHSLSNCQIYNPVLFTTVTMLHILYPQRLVYLITGSLYLLISFIHFTHPPLPMITNVFCCL